MTLDASEEVVKNGTFIYAGTVTCDLRIVRSQTRPGSGDWEDSPDIANDEHGEFFQVQYGSTTARGRFNASGAYVVTLAEAIAEAESAPGISSTVRWID